MKMKLNYLYLYVIAALVLSNLNAQVNPGDKNLIHSWTFNDGTSKDYIGKSEGILKGGAKILNGALNTTAANSWMEMPASKIAINELNEVTIEAWFKPLANENTNFHMLAYFGNTQNSIGVNYFFMTPARLDDVSRAAISCDDTSTPWSAETGVNGPEIDDGQLHHMVATLNTTEISFYIDGELKGNTLLASNNSIKKLHPIFAYLAKSGYNDDATWKGEIFEFNIFNKVLTSADILSRFNNGAVPTNIKEIFGLLPMEFSLMQNYPNPFNPSTSISFNLPENSFVSLKIYNSLGQEIAELAGKDYTVGNHTIKFNPVDFASGVYFYTMRAGKNTFTRKMILTK
jgi:hypothetical protein